METKELIKNALASGKSISQVYADLGAMGISVEDIDIAFKTAMVEKEQTIKTSSLTQVNIQEKKFNLTKAFLLIGGILIVVAVIIVITTSWSNLGPFGRILFLFTPMVALFGIFFATKKYDNYKEISNSALMLSLFTFPLFIGTTLYQTGIIPIIDSGLILTTALLSLPVFILAEYFLKKYLISIYTIAAVTVSVSAFCGLMTLDARNTLWLVTLSAIIITFMGSYLARIDENSAKIYLGFGSIYSIFLFTISVFTTLNFEEALSAQSNALILCFFGLSYLFIAIACYQFYKQNNIKTYYYIKRVLEEVAPMVMIFGLMLGGVKSTPMIVLPLLLSALAIFLSTKVRIKTLVVTGSLGLVISTIWLTSKIFSDSVGWPAVLLVAGLASFGLAFLVRKLLKDRELPLMPVFGLGVDTEIENQNTNHISTVAKVIYIILGIFFLVPLVLFLAFRMLFGSFF
ncbi:MAG: DUF2157 domain-containing protein [bacterium]